MLIVLQCSRLMTMLHLQVVKQSVHACMQHAGMGRAGMQRTLKNGVVGGMMWMRVLAVWMLRMCSVCL